MTDNNGIEAELVSFFRAILGEDLTRFQNDDGLAPYYMELMADLSSWSDLFTICPQCRRLFVLCPWCEALISSYDEFCEHGFACLGAAK